MLVRLIGSSARRRIVVAAVAAVLVGSLIVLFLLVTNRPRTNSSAPARHPAPTSASSAPPSAPTEITSNPPGLPPGLPRTDDPVAYAGEVATALFGVNPAEVSRAEFLLFWRGELPTVVYSDAAMNGLTLAAQNADALDNLTKSWIPSQTAWSVEAAERVVSRFTITSVSVPDYWLDAVAQGSFRDPGLRMERVMGVLRQTYGTDRTHRQGSARSVVIDLALLCGPTQPGGCRLLAPQTAPDDGGATS